MYRAGRLQRDRDPTVLFEGLNFYEIRHGNKGYARDPETGEYLGDEYGEVHMGYVWHYQCVEMPASAASLQHSPSTCHSSPSRPRVSYPAPPVRVLAIARLNAAPLLTLGEFVVLERIGDFPVEYREAINRVAGAVNPTPHIIRDRWAMVSSYIDQLRAKGVIKCNEEGILYL